MRAGAERQNNVQGIRERRIPDKVEVEQIEQMLCCMKIWKNVQLIDKERCEFDSKVKISVGTYLHRYIIFRSVKSGKTKKMLIV